MKKNSKFFKLSAASKSAASARRGIWDYGDAPSSSSKPINAGNDDDTDVDVSSDYYRRLLDHIRQADVENSSSKRNDCQCDRNDGTAGLGNSLAPLPSSEADNWFSLLYPPRSRIHNNVYVLLRGRDVGSSYGPGE